jgi:dTDP-glucose 4,6-dehydratase
LRDFIFIDDVVGSIFKCYKNEKAKGQIFNIGSGEPKKIRQIINLVKKLVGFGRPKFGKIKVRSDENLKLYPSISKAKKILNWRPTISLREGILKTVKFYKKDF